MKKRKKVLRIVSEADFDFFSAIPKYGDLRVKEGFRSLNSSIWINSKLVFLQISLYQLFKNYGESSLIQHYPFSCKKKKDNEYSD